jgi:hypothetical protein
MGEVMLSDKTKHVPLGTPIELHDGASAMQPDSAPELPPQSDLFGGICDVLLAGPT